MIGRLQRTAHPVGAHRAGEGEGGEVQRDFLGQLAQARLLPQRRQVAVRVDRSVVEQVEQEPLRRLGVDQRLDVLRGEVLADQVRPPGAAERQ